MRKIILSFTFYAFFSLILYAQNIKFEEYELANGIHVILHQDHTAPVVTTGVMYHVGSKNEEVGRSGFAHFFEHLLFEGSPNIKRGEWSKIVSSNGGTNNANTTSDRTYYYETFPSNNLQLGLWMESERLRHPIINQIGVDTQREVVKEEKRLNMDSRPYGNLLTALQENLFTKHPYRWTTIGSMEDINQAQLSEFKDFFKKYYTTSNTTLVVAGDFDKDQATDWIHTYFGSIPKSTTPQSKFAQEDPITDPKESTYKDPNIQLPAYLFAYRVPGYRDKESYALSMLSNYLSGGKSSVLYKKLVDRDKKALEVAAINLGLEDYGIFAFFAIPMGMSTKDILKQDIDLEIKKLQTDLISDEDYKKLQNMIENQFVNKNANIQGIASSLATYHVLYGDTHLINQEIDIYRSITKENLREAAKKYLKPNQRVIINYLPEKK
ncbi:insulinase family protein [Elizabethkingia argentiflava]|uniref:Insulinase family protein n=1 Tax=Elizabethkingia argenteiflava TaxID=2681556 RepID=A0A845PS17_9FLAO|nr:pitrilysin family protein [Elizabethkingia argenteiflava]NAW51059.1 insulinase family protein [Elizabethkingia argenteiflava]